MQTSPSKEGIEKNPASLLGAEIGTGPKKTACAQMRRKLNLLSLISLLWKETFGQYRDFGESQTSSLFNLSPEKWGNITLSQKLS